MKNSKFIDLFKILSPKEQKKFKAYVFSPFFNKNEKIRMLLETIYEVKPTFDHPNLQKQSLHQLLFKTDHYNEYQINNIISDLSKLLYDFLAYQQYEKDKQRKKSLLLEEMLEREELNQFNRISNSYQQLQQNNPHLNYQHHLDDFNFHDKMVRYNLAIKMRARDEHLQLQNDSLDLAYFSNKLRIACDMVSRNIVTNADYKCHFLNDIIERYEQNYLEYQSKPALTVYYKTLQLINNQSEDSYRELKQYLAVHLSIFPNEELRILYVYLQNFCIYKLNSGDSSYYKELRDLYQVLLENKIIFKNGYLMQWTFKNIVTVGIRLSDFEWTETIINKYKEFLFVEQRPNAVAYNMAALQFAQENYSAALKQLHNVEFTDTVYHLGAKIIQIKSYFELKETEALFSLIEAFKKYILRNKELAPYRKKANANFLKLVKKVYQLKETKKSNSNANWKKKQDKIFQFFENIAPIANKEWLESKLV